MLCISRPFLSFSFVSSDDALEFSFAHNLQVFSIEIVEILDKFIGEIVLRVL